MDLLNSKGSRLGNGMAVTLVLCALIADLLSLIPLVGDLVGPIFWIMVSVYLWTKGCGFLRTNRLVTQIISAVAEMIPAIQELPTIIVGMVIVLIMIRLEDKTGKSILKPLSKKEVPLNSNSIRLPSKTQNQTDNGEDLPLTA